MGLLSTVCRAAWEMGLRMIYKQSNDGRGAQRRKENYFPMDKQEGDSEECELSNVFFMSATHTRDFGWVCRSGLRCRILCTLIFLKGASVESGVETDVLLIQHANSWVSHQVLRVHFPYYGAHWFTHFSLLFLRFVFIKPFEFKIRAVTPWMNFTLLLFPPE